MTPAAHDQEVDTAGPLQQRLGGVAGHCDLPDLHRRLRSGNLLDRPGQDMLCRSARPDVTEYSSPA
ncbi:hypothetical protein OG196_06720 [Kitasatospora purpeofusca]|uniref:hypothetical protein n=1 Tax=Kitasatospora purpeofusca TaxID=67352 RepID=UPI002E0D334C|nr:hypothetical protein OG715_06075 [Kitasatospora purpeofusca]WSR38804.1 hypothetical protein OG196_06720 [Kitasatospora purpeofusca]